MYIQMYLYVHICVRIWYIHAFTYNISILAVLYLTSFVAMSLILVFMLRFVIKIVVWFIIVVAALLAVGKSFGLTIK